MMARCVELSRIAVGKGEYPFGTVIARDGEILAEAINHTIRDGDVTRLLQFDAGVETTETITHDFWEEVWILEGELIDLGKHQTFTAGMYACRPPGMLHGPYRVSKGCVTFEVRYVKR